MPPKQGSPGLVCMESTQCSVLVKLYLRTKDKIWSIISELEDAILALLPFVHCCSFRCEFRQTHLPNLTCTSLPGFCHTSHTSPHVSPRRLSAPVAGLYFTRASRLLLLVGNITHDLERHLGRFCLKGDESDPPN